MTDWVRGRVRRRRKLWLRQEKICTWCDNPITTDQLRRSTTVDHVVPKSHGGPGTYDNIQVLHTQCNYEKGTTCPGGSYCVKGCK